VSPGAPKATRSSGRASVALPPTLPAPSVLLVDDRRENLVALEAVLEPLELELVSVTSGEQALRELLRSDFAVILLDVQMPGMDGFQTAELIKARQRTRHIPIIFVTAISKQPEHVFRGYETGAVDYVFKPINDEVLRSKVLALVELHRKREELRAQEDELRARETEEVRRAEQQRYRELAEAMPQIVWVSDPAGRATYYNGRWFAYTGLDPVEAGDSDWRVVVHPADLREAMERRDRSLETGEPLEVEYRFRRADGTYRWHLGRAVPVRDADGAIDHWVGTATDIDDQKRAQESQQFLVEASSVLGSSLDYQSTLSSVAHLAVPTIADWCTIEIVEDGELRELEVAHEDPMKLPLVRELRGRYPRAEQARVVATGEAQLVSEVTDELLRDAAVDSVHLDLLRDLAPRSTIVAPIIVRDRVLGTITLVSSVSERVYGPRDLALAEDVARRAAVAIENARLYERVDAQAQAARVLAAIGDGVALVDQDGVVRLWNPAAEQISGVGEDDAIGKRLDDIVPGWRATDDGRAETVPLEVAGREIWLSISGVRFDDGTVYAFRDLTHERALESMRQDLVATVSHELRTPLAAIYGAAVTLGRRDIGLDEELRDRLLSIVIEESERLSEIVNDLLIASQLDAGSLPVTIQATDARALAEAVIDSARAHLPDGTTIELTAAPSLPRVAADPGQLRQVLDNLLENAVKYSPSGGQIDITLEPRADVLRFAVRDPGLGIPAGEQRRIFEKFYRLDPDMSHGVGGTGLGLYICRELVRRVGGKIWVNSREREGSTFFVEIPLARPRARKESAAAA
jgi:PAS domain S-box-containing protein